MIADCWLDHPAAAVKHRDAESASVTTCGLASNMLSASPMGDGLNAVMARLVPCFLAGLHIRIGAAGDIFYYFTS